MDIHKPKPIHNWREFLKELGTIALGVCIALAAEQGVEWWHWRGQVAEARALIASELSRNVAQAMWRVRTEKCGERRLDELGAILDAASRTGALPPVGDIGSPSFGIWIRGAWESAVASQAAVHFPREELVALNTIYKFIQNADEQKSNEQTQWNALYAMAGPGRRLDSASEARLRDALSQARGANRSIDILSGNLIKSVQALNLPFSPSDLKWIARGQNDPLVKSRNVFSSTGYLCAPIDAVPAVYGQAMWKFVPYVEDDTLQRYPKFPDSPTKADANKPR